MTASVFAAGAPCWLDLMTADLPRAQDFYSQLLGWDFRDTRAEPGGIADVVATLDGEPVAGLVAKQPEQENFPDVWCTALGTTDIEETLRRTAEAGGRVLFEAIDVTDLGRMAMIQDSAGAALNLWQPRESSGFARVREPGAPFWHEVFTRDFAASVEFYRHAFGWDVTVVSDTDAFRYATLGAADDARAGIMDASAWLPADVPSHWRVYFGVPDAAEAASRVSALGGRVLAGPESTPFGSILTIQDPLGAHLLLASEHPA